MPTDSRKKIAVYEWLMWQMGGYGPMLGQAHHFLRYNVGKAPYAEERYRNETLRLYGVLDRRLVDNCNSGGAAVEHRFNLFFAAFLIQTRLIDGFDEIVFCDVGLDLVN